MGQKRSLSLAEYACDRLSRGCLCLARACLVCHDDGGADGSKMSAIRYQLLERAADSAQFALFGRGRHEQPVGATRAGSRTGGAAPLSERRGEEPLSRRRLCRCCCWEAALWRAPQPRVK